MDRDSQHEPAVVCWLQSVACVEQLSGAAVARQKDPSRYHITQANIWERLVNSKSYLAPGARQYDRIHLEMSAYWVAAGTKVDS